MKSNKQIVDDLITATVAVQKLATSGFKVLSVSMGNLHPMITIDPPGQALISRKLLNAQPISVRCSASNPELIFAARFCGCLVTWAAEINNVKGAA